MWTRRVAGSLPRTVRAVATVMGSGREPVYRISPNLPSRSSSQTSGFPRLSRLRTPAPAISFQPHLCAFAAQQLPYSIQPVLLFSLGRLLPCGALFVYAFYL